MHVLRLTLRQLQIFAAVARHRSTQAAALDIALSQSATSAALNALERQLGLQLFDRAGRRLLLNENGRALLPRAQALLDAAASLEREAGGGALATLRIGASTTIGNHLLPGLLARLDADSAHGWRGRATIDNTAAICAAVAAFELDIGLIEGPSPQRDLVLLPWVDDELVLVAAPDSALLRGAGPTVGLDALRDAVWLLREPGSGTRDATDQLLLPHLHGWSHCIELGSSEAILNAAALGLGVACLSRWVVEPALQQGRLQQLRTPLPALHRRCHIVLHRDKHRSAALERVLEQAAAIAAELSARPPAPMR